MFLIWQTYDPFVIYFLLFRKYFFWHVEYSRFFSMCEYVYVYVYN